MTIPIRGTAALLVAAAIVAGTAIWFAARWFLPISVGIGVAVGAACFFGTGCDQLKRMMSKTSGLWG